MAQCGQVSFLGRMSRGEQTPHLYTTEEGLSGLSSLGEGMDIARPLSSGPKQGGVEGGKGRLSGSSAGTCTPRNYRSEIGFGFSDPSGLTFGGAL